MIEGVVGVIIWTESIERLLPFYRDKLGLTPHSVHEDFVSFSFGEVRLSIGLHSQVVARSKEPQRIMINLGTKHVEEVYRSLTEKGVEFVRPPELEHWGWVGSDFPRSRRKFSAVAAAA